jgi:ABC-type sulfate/molybdate transport systems ATPase subunit
VSVSASIRLELPEFTLDVAFQVGDGITALFGPSGAGKSLTLRSIAGLAGPTGRIEVSGRVLLDTAVGVSVPPRERRIGYLFQQYALFPHLSVERNVGYGLQGVARAERAARVAALLSLVGLDGFAARSPRELSGGQQQRVALARALAPRPDLLLLDEPFAALDLRVRRRVRAELRQIHAVTRTPMLLVTHDLAEVRQLADSIVVLDGGRVLGAGPTGPVLAQREGPVAELIRELFD